MVRGKWLPGDRLLLMTDALAQWFLTRNEAGKKPWRSIAQLLTDPSPEKAFATWIEEQRAKQSLRNDDVTLVVVDLLPSKSEVLIKD